MGSSISSQATTGFVCYISFQTPFSFGSVNFFILPKFPDKIHRRINVYGTLRHRIQKRSDFLLCTCLLHPLMCFDLKALSYCWYLLKLIDYFDNHYAYSFYTCCVHIVPRNAGMYDEIRISHAYVEVMLSSRYTCDAETMYLQESSIFKMGLIQITFDLCSCCKTDSGFVNSHNSARPVKEDV